MAERSATTKALHRCRVVLNVYRGEQSVSLGPGSIVSAELVAELVARGDVRADCFDEISGDLEAVPEESDKEE